MTKWILIFIFMMFPCSFLPAETQDQLENLVPTETQRLSESERSQQSLQQQVERLDSATKQNGRDIGDMNQTLNNLRRRVDEMDKEIDDLRSKHQDLARRLGR